MKYAFEIEKNLIVCFYGDMYYVVCFARRGFIRAQNAHGVCERIGQSDYFSRCELDNGAYYLAGDVELDAPLKVMVGKEATLNLNGHILKLKYGVSGSVITVDGGTLTLVDGDPDNPHDDIAIKGGVITGGNGNVNGNGGGVLIDFEVLSSSSKYGTLTMNGGTI